MKTMANKNTSDQVTPGNVERVLPETVVLASRPGAWQGLEVVQRRHELNDHEFPALTSYVIGINLGRTLDAVEQIDGRTYSGCMVKGEVNVLPVGLPSRWRWKGREEADALHLYLAPSLLHEVAAGTGAINPDRIEIVNHLAVRDPRIEHIGLALKAELEGGCAAGRLYGESLATALAVHLLRNYSATESVIREYKGGLPKYKLRRVVEFINENLEYDVPLTELAGVAGMNIHHFAKMFKRATGLAPHQYVIRCRIERAKRLLADPELTIAEVCQAVGFDNQSHFTKLFRRHVAATPKAYRDAL